MLSLALTLAALPFVAGSLHTLNDNGGWCWFQDDRAVWSHGKLYVGSIGNGAGAGGVARHGAVEVTRWDPQSQTTVTAKLAELGADDHNSPALLMRPDGHLVAAYSGHDADRFSRFRISARPYDVQTWGPEIKAEWPAPTTYSQLHLVRDEAKKEYLVSIVRAAGNDPWILISASGGERWKRAGRLFSSPGRPYLKTFSDRKRIHIVATQNNPRAEATHLYHGYLEGKRLFDSFGNVVDDDVLDENAVPPEKLTLVREGTKSYRPWISDLGVDGKGNPVIAYTVRVLSPNGKISFDYHLATFQKGGWISRYLAPAGRRPLSADEGDYTGLVALPKRKGGVVYLSTTAHPATGDPLISASDGKEHWEIFKGTAVRAGWKWEAITRDSVDDNLRPLVPAGRAPYETLLWLRGHFDTYRQYRLSVVGILR